jgi:membrane protein implicated in regulation of membrane protease activity
MSSHLPLALPVLLLLAGAGIAVLEAVAPGAHFIVLGTTLFVAGLLGVLLPSVFGGALALAAVVLIVGAVTLYGYRELDLYTGSGSGRTRDSDSLRGRTGRVTERVTETEGQVKLDGGGFNPHYVARSVAGTIEEGQEVVVVDPGGGNVLTVEALEGAVDDIDRALAEHQAATESAGDESPDEAEQETERA